MTFPEDIHSIEIDYRNGALSVNGVQIKDAVIVAIPNREGWNRSKLFNPENASAPVTATVRIGLEGIDLV
jgi:hypothetical protein